MRLKWNAVVEAGADSVKTAMGFVERQMSFQRLNAVQKALQTLLIGAVQQGTPLSPSIVYHLIHS